MLTTDHLIGMGQVDAGRLGVVGGSHGGFLSCQLTSKPGIAHRFKVWVSLRVCYTSRSISLTLGHSSDSALRIHHVCMFA